MSLLAAALKYCPLLPESVLRALFAVGAHAAVTAHQLGLGPRGIRQLEKNLQRVAPLASARARRARTRRAFGHYMRYYAETFKVPGLTGRQIDARMWLEGDKQIFTDIQDRSVVLALSHSGNWDLAGAWAARNLQPVLTVAERIQPADAFAAYLELRQKLQMTILPVSREDKPFPQLVRLARRELHLVPLLADRDLSASGLLLPFAGHEALFAAGPAALALATKLPLYVGSIRHVRLRGARRRKAGSRWGVVIDVRGPLTTELPGAAGVEDLTRQWTAWFATWLARHSEHWHMLQPVFLADLDPARLAKRRQETP